MQDALIWIGRMLVGAVIAFIGLHLLGIDLSEFPWWKSMLGLLCLSIGFQIMPGLRKT